MKVTERHIFKDVSPYFSEMTTLFCERYVDCFLAVGASSPEVPINKVKMVKNPDYDSVFHRVILEFISHDDPLILCESFIGSKLSSKCSFYYLNDYEDIEGFYMTQRSLNWKSLEQSTCQVSKLIKCDLKDINKHWL